jgi:[ribosomal protein S18]-alanine N-acetyltransferase
MKTMPDIRLLQDGEEALLQALYSDCFEEPFGEEGFRSLLASPGMWAAIAWRDAAVGCEAVGFVLARYAVGEAEIISIGVLPSARRCGIGAALLEDALCRSVVLGTKRIFLEVSEENPGAISLYRAAGFEEVGRREDYYQTKTKRTVAALIMRHTVKKSVS